METTQTWLNFVERRFQCNLSQNPDVDGAPAPIVEDSNNTAPATETLEETPIYDTPANRAFMQKFCRVI